MKTNVATTQSQSARLLRCGVSADTADMCLSTRTRRYDGTFIAKKHQTTNLWIGYPCRRTTSGDEELENIPAWSLSALLTKVLPHNISVDKYKYKEATEYEVGCYFTGHRDKIAFNALDPIEACVQLIEWLTENNYKLNEINKEEL